MNIDTTKLITVSNYAKLKKLSRSAIYKRISRHTLSTIDIDGVKFIVK